MEDEGETEKKKRTGDREIGKRERDNGKEKRKTKNTEWQRGEREGIKEKERVRERKK